MDYMIWQAMSLNGAGIGMVWFIQEEAIPVGQHLEAVEYFVAGIGANPLTKHVVLLAVILHQTTASLVLVFGV